MQTVTLSMKANHNYREDSIYTLLRAQLFGSGLFEDQADAVLERLMADQPEMKGRWNDPAADYQRVLIAALWMSAKAGAVKWIDENCPKHWAREVFV